MHGHLVTPCPGTRPPMLYAIPIRSVWALCCCYSFGAVFSLRVEPWRFKISGNSWLTIMSYWVESFLTSQQKRWFWIVVANLNRESPQLYFRERERNQYKVIPGCAAKTSKLVRKRKSIEGSSRTCTIIVYPTKCEFLELCQHSTHLGHLLDIEPFTFSRCPTIR